jgi:hypothetical protein
VSAGAAELVVGVLSALVVVDVGLGVALARALQRIARLEERTKPDA